MLPTATLSALDKLKTNSILGRPRTRAHRRDTWKQAQAQHVKPSLENTCLKALWPWVIWSLAVAFVFFQFFMQLSTGVMLSQLMRDFSISALGAGILSGSFYFIYVLLQTPAGMMADWFGPRRLLSFGGLVCAIGLALFSSSNNFTEALTGRLLTGLGSSFAFVCTLHLIRQWFPASHFGLMLGLADTIGMLGSLVGNVCLANALEQSSWRGVMAHAAWVALLLGALCFLVIRDTPGGTKHTPKTDLKTFLGDVQWLLKNPILWLNGLFSGVLFCVVTVFAALWVLPFLELYQHASLSAATAESALVYIGIAIGGPVMGYFYPRMLRCDLFLSACSLLAGFISAWIIFFTPQSVTFCAFLFFMLGIACSSYVMNLAIVNELVPEHVRSTAIGFTNMLCVSMAPILQPLIGWLLHQQAKHHALAEELYTLADYHWALSVIPLSLFIAALIALKLPTPSHSDH